MVLFCVSKDSKPSKPKSCLPQEVPCFTGRKRECEDIISHVVSGSARIVSIWGPPGFGKTSLAITVGHRLRSQGFPAYFISMREVQSKADLSSKLLSFLRPPVTSDQQNQQRHSIDDELSHLFSEMTDPFTIILDGVDEFLLSQRPEVKEDFTHFLADILKRTEEVSFIITTRESLESLNMQFQGHQAMRIGPLDEPSCQNLVNKLLPNAPPIDRKRVTQTCGHVPLAMKLLCGTISEDNVDLAEFLNDLESENVVEMYDHPDDTRNLRLKLLFNSSFMRLSGLEKEALLSLSVLSESFDPAIAATVLGISQVAMAEKILLNLKRKCFLESSSKPWSFVMHPLIRWFANQREEHEMKGSRASLRQLQAQDKPGKSSVITLLVNQKSGKRKVWQ